MVPTENLYKQHHHHLPHGGGDCGGFYGCWDHSSNYKESFSLMSRVHGHGYDYHSGGACLGSDPMAEDESRTNSLNNEEGSCSSKDNNNQDQAEDWLQLSIGSQATRIYDHHQNNKQLHDDHDHDHQGDDDPTVRRGGLMELDLLPAPSGGGTGSLQLQQARPLAPIFHMPDQFRAAAPPRPAAVMHSFSNTTSLFFQHQQGSSSADISWAFRPIPQNINIAAASASSSSLAYFPSPPFQVQSGIMDIAGPSSDVRIIDPPTRPYSGIWFTLQASENQ